MKTQQALSDYDPEVTRLTRALSIHSDCLELISVGPASEAAPIPSPAAPIESQPHEPSPHPQKVDKEADASGTVRVPVPLLDHLMTLVGEMVLVRNQVIQFSNKSEDPEFLSMSKRLNVVTSEIQGEMMKTRMQPLGNVIGKFNRVVRDLSQELKKNIQLVLMGAETELDKSLLEAIKDPLTHIVRNSCDHGIETPEIRRKSGKSDTGNIQIKAYHEGGQVVIEVMDDGKGLNPEVLLKKGIEKGLVNPAQASKMGEREIFNLIFAPGFSTAAAVTNVSGRGVGMDVVRTNIERIGGTIDLSSKVGHGTSIKIKIPLTLAIVPALIVKSGQGSFAIPQVNLEELVRVDSSSEQENRIEMLHGTPVYRLRGNILPLLDLNRVLGINSAHPNSSVHTVTNIAVVSGDQGSFGLMIDEVLDTADIVVKPINRLLKSTLVYAGATVLGDGKIALILDVPGLAKVGQISRKHATLSKSENLDQDRQKRAADIQDFLLFQLESPTKHAIPLSYINRLEEFPAASVELSGHKRVIRYRNVILPLVSANQAMNYATSAKEGTDPLKVLVIQRSGTLFGIEVDEILDTLSTPISVDSDFITNPNIFGNLNMPEELVVVLDPFALITKAFPELFQAEQMALHSNTASSIPIGNVAPPPLSKNRSHALSARPKRILLVEDTAFFRKALRIVLEKSGFEVHSANDGQDAIDILNRQDTLFDMVISDIEMPRMNGFQLATTLRNHPVHSRLPLLAVSSRADRQYVIDGKKAGFDIYLEKLKPELLLASIAELLERNKGAA
jgi:two-component system chemotaxis sensor kinase CheA